MRLFRRARATEALWRVQAVLLSSVTGTVEWRYSPIYVYGEKAAIQKARELARGFDPRAVRIERAPVNYG